MEASHILRGMEDEDRSSSESGWTMYIGSPIHENDHYNYIGEYSSNNNTYKQEEGFCKNRYRNYSNSQKDDESDDSMASDASSGPSHYKFPCSNEQNLGMDQYKHEKTESTSSEKLHKQEVRREQRRNKKETLELKTTNATSHIQSRNKSKTTSYISHKGISENQHGC